MVYYVSDQDSPLEDHLYRVSLDGGAPQPLSSGSGNHHIDMDGRNQHYLDTFSNLGNPSGNDTARCRQVTVERVLAQKPDRGELRSSASGNRKSFAERRRPCSCASDPAGKLQASEHYPAVVFVYGGPQIQSIRNMST